MGNVFEEKVRASILHDLQGMDTESLLDVYERVVQIRHYDPFGEGHPYFEHLDIVRGEIDRRMSPPEESEEEEYPECDTCHTPLHYMPWHYSTETKRHLHACDTCWPHVNPARK